MSADAPLADIEATATAALSVSRSEALLLADELRDQKRTGELIQVLKVVLAHSPADGDAAYELCLAYARAGRADDARAALQAAAAADPWHPMRARASKAIELLR